MKWITRKDIKVDRVACPWLIRRFIDATAGWKKRKRCTLHSVTDRLTRIY